MMSPYKSIILPFTSRISCEKVVEMVVVPNLLSSQMTWKDRKMKRKFGLF